MTRHRIIPLLIVLLATIPESYAGRLKFTKEEKSWLRSVELIITPDERKFFREGCSTHEERSEFIELFWAKRDPDLSDDVNEFKQEYQARMDYVVAHYREMKGRSPRTDRGYVYMLLGPPTKILYRTDERFVGMRYRNPFPAHPPELWIYENLPYETRGNRVIIQMVPKNRFGDYDALVSPHVEHMLRTLKYELIVHPDLDAPPLRPEESEDLQDLVAAKTEDTGQQVPVPVPAPQQTDQETPAAFNPDLPNDLDLTAEVVLVAQGSETSTALVRFGFPLKHLTPSQTESGERRFSLQYALADPQGNVVAQALKQHVLTVPKTAALKNSRMHFAQSFSALVNPGTHTFQLQLRNLDFNGGAYFSTEFQVPQAPPDLPVLSPLFFLDPAPETETNHLNLRGKKFSPHLRQTFSKGEPIYLLFQALHMEEPLVEDDVRLTALNQSGDQVKSWSLYPEELAAPVGVVQTCYPRLDTRSLDSGEYTLRCEVKQKNGSILIKERALSID